MQTFFLISFIATLAFADESVVTINNGQVQGIVGGNYRKFLGIPFAEAPIGDLRWKSPLPHSNWEGVLQAQAYSKDCPQKGQSTSGSNTDEDCLFINVFTPRMSAKNASYPVMFFIYGGCWDEGAASLPVYKGENIIKQNPNVVVVTFNYRLGNYGFLGSEALAKESPDGSTGNYGLQDQRLALQWVRDNIAYFQGDPHTVMVFGQSAGSASIANHLIMPKSKGLFHRATMESGPFSTWTAITLEQAYELSGELVENSQCNLGNDGETLECLRNLTTDQLQQLAPNHCNRTCCWSPVIDGVEITDVPSRLAEEGLFQKVPVVLGSNLDEGSIFVNFSHSLTEQEYKDDIIKKYGADLGGEILQYYPSSNYQSPWWATVAIWTDAYFSCPARRSARWLSQGTEVYLYFWTHAIYETTVLYPYLGAYHGVELPFVFGDPDGFYYGFPIVFTPWELQFEKKMVSYWTQFAISGNPNVDGLPSWPQYNLTADANINLDETITTGSGLKQDLCNFWDKALP